MAMTGVLRMGHAQIRVLDLEKSARFYSDVLGLEETGRDNKGRVYFKCWDEHDHHSLVIRQADSPGVDYVGYKVLDRETLDHFEEKLRQECGLEPRRIPAGEMLETGERVRFEVPSGHQIELFADKTNVGNGPTTNPPPWSPRRDHGIGPARVDHCLLYGPNIAAVKRIFVDVLGFRVQERIMAPGDQDEAAIFLTCSHKPHDIAFVEFPERGKLHHVSFLMETWEQVLRAGDIMSMNNVKVDIGPTRHGVTRGSTIYAWDPSGNRFETFSGGYAAYPDQEPLTWTNEAFGQGLDYPQRKLHESFLTIVT